jgi:demethylmenaquinone methyltransferase/2-methoxy-6-polyprenyl-1,4-benzoquinol methylase
MNIYPHDTVVPFKNSTESKKKQVENMFDKIAFRYDFLNRFLSAGIDIGWRKKAIKQLILAKPQKILDVATGTGDFAITSYEILKPEKIIGIDISDGMLDIGRKKIAKAGLENSIELINGDSEAILFDDNSFDAVTVAFGVRNFENLEKGLSEIKRVLKPGGKLIVLECTKPSLPVLKQLYNFYMKFVTPKIGKIIAKNNEAYQYLNDSVLRFPEKKSFIHILNQSDYRNAFYKTLTLGICTIYCAEK